MASLLFRPAQNEWGYSWSRTSERPMVDPVISGGQLARIRPVLGRYPARWPTYLRICPVGAGV